MSFEPGPLLLSFLFGSIGLVAFLYGKRQHRFPHMVCGAALMAYPYFVPGILPMVLIGVGLIAALWLAVRFGA